MTNVLWAALLFVGYLIGAHASEVCELQSHDFTDLQSILKAIKDDYSPKMTFSFQLNKDCSYKSDSEVEIYDDQPLETFLARKIMNPAMVMKASQGAMKKLNYEDTHSFVQTMEAVYDFPVKVISNCTKNSDDKTVTSICEATEGKVKVLIKKYDLFERHTATISCRVASATTKRCTIGTEGQAKRIAIRGACTVAEDGAKEGFTATYRLAHLLNHGIVDKQQMRDGEDFIKDILERAKVDPSIAKNVQVP